MTCYEAHPILAKNLSTVMPSEHRLSFTVLAVLRRGM